jgi:hypothetical protein
MTSDEYAALLPAIIAALKEVVAVLEGASSGKIDPQVALNSLTSFQQSIAANNAAADAALAAKFPVQS